MVTKIQRWGNSQGLRLARQVLEDTCISVGDDVDVVARDGIIVISPVRRVRGDKTYGNWYHAYLKTTSRKNPIGANLSVERCGK